jgi:hypothetical protein
MSESKKLVVTTSGDRSMSDIENELTDKGFIIDEVYDAIGIISGEVTDDDVVDRLRAIPGVTDVSPEPPPININPPPGEPEVW